LPSQRPPIQIVGGGLAGSEAALQLAGRGHAVELFEMRPVQTTPAHHSPYLAELVCSNTFKSERHDTAAGAFKAELELLGSRLLPLAHRARVPGGHALALDRELFARLVTEAIEAHPNITLRREEITALAEDRPQLVASGPLTSPALESYLRQEMDDEGLYFYDAIAPSVLLDTVDLGIVFKASRYDKGDADYLNCPLDRHHYESFVDALLAAERVPMKDFERAAYFSGCMPIEAIADGGRESLRFGPMRPVGLMDPRSGRRPYAVVQLRQETRDGTLFGLVGFQTQLRHGAQLEVFRRIPGLRQAEFVRLGSLHRNTYLNTPRHLAADLSWGKRSNIWFAGQLIGGEGYVESLGTGLVAALSIHGRVRGSHFEPPPVETLLGALLAYLRDPTVERISPMNVNFGLLPALENSPRSKQERRQAHAQRALEAMRRWRAAHATLFGDGVGVG
jgi:methylenetetrahydrofolate--tRNA-(uracil-5-)-methyltransferase